MINIAEILKDCPKGTKLYSPLCGECYFDRVSYDTIICKKQNSQEITFTSKGYYMLPVFDDSEPVLFPSKENRDWSTFQRPFKDGDIVYIQSLYEYIVIYKKTNCKKIYKHAAICISFNNHLLLNNNILCCEEEVKKIRLATEEEKQKLFQAIKEKGYKWNAETKSLEMLIKPKFKVGDKIVDNSGLCTYIIKSVSDEYYGLELHHGIGVMPVKHQDDWELVSDKVEPKFKVGDRIKYIYYDRKVAKIIKIYDDKYELDNGKFIYFQDENAYEISNDKFDTTTLKPFESRVLVRNYHYECWRVSFFGHFDKFMGKFDTVRGEYMQCIPYEGNEHLLNTTDDCDEFYKNW